MNSTKTNHKALQVLFITATLVAPAIMQAASFKFPSITYTGLKPITIKAAIQMLAKKMATIDHNKACLLQKHTLNLSKSRFFRN